jgi:hypothetical protein
MPLAEKGVRTPHQFVKWFRKGRYPSEGSGANSIRGRLAGFSALSVRDGIRRRAPHSTVATCSSCSSQTCRF